MNVLFVLENTADHPKGGTEISSRHLANLLRRRGITVIEWSPFGKRTNPFFYTSFLLLPYFAIRLIREIIRNRIQIIHVQGKYLIPASVIVGKLLHVPVIATIRDYMICCPIGLCLFKQSTSHDFLFFLRKEIQEFIWQYHRLDHPLVRFIRCCFLLRAWGITIWIRWWAKRADTVISVSEAVKKILKAYKISSQTIYNCFDTETYQQMISSKDQGKNDREIIFVGKDSYGKGSDLFDALSANKKFKELTFKKITTNNWLSYEETLRALRAAVVVIVPSRWQEPFGRVALEAIAIGTPVIATRQGGLPEIVKHHKNGVVSQSVSETGLSESLSWVLNNKNTLKKRMTKYRKEFIEKFSKTPINQHIHLYSQLLIKNPFQNSIFKGSGPAARCTPDRFSNKSRFAGGHTRVTRD